MINDKLYESINNKCKNISPNIYTINKDSFDSKNHIFIYKLFKNSNFKAYFNKNFYKYNYIYL